MGEGGAGLGLLGGGVGRGQELRGVRWGSGGKGGDKLVTLA